MSTGTQGAFLRSQTINLLLSILATMILGGSLVGCGGSQISGALPPAGNTQVVVLLTSTANDQLVSFNVVLASIALVDKAGNSTTLYSNTVPFGPFGEWMHLNGVSEPLPAVSVPQGTYRSAVVTVNGCSFTTIGFAANTVNTSTDDEGLCAEGTGVTTVNLPNPIQVSGSVMGLSLNLQIAQSFTLDAAANPATYTIDPVFTLTPVSIAAQPTNETNGKVSVIDAQITSVGADGKTVTAETADGAPVTMVTGASTTFQGISGFSALTANMLFSFDGAIQSDGSLLATRVEVDSPTAVAGVVGPFILPVEAPRDFTIQNLIDNGCMFVNTPFCDSIFQQNNAVFTVSGEITNLASLPFPASFTNANFLQGQNIFVFASGSPNQQSIEQATAITLMPQTLNGTVLAVTNNGGFIVYTVSLAPYDLIPVLQNFTDNAPPPHLASPNTIVVYADTNTQFLNSGTVGAGSLIRFRGVIFDDNGTARMDATTIYDGVTE
jgi:hypothetical protein